MPHRKSQLAHPSQAELLDVTARLRTGPCVPALREAVKAWRAGKYKGITDTTRILLNHWFYTDHKSRTGQPFKYHASHCVPFPWSRPVWEGRKCILNMVPCDNEFERDFAKFLENASDVRAFSKLPQAFGFAIDYTDAAMNLRSYYPDFVAVDESGGYWILETKGQETPNVARKDAAASLWCENATRLTKCAWKFAKVPQKEFETLQPSRLGELTALQPRTAY